MGRKTRDSELGEIVAPNPPSMEDFEQDESGVRDALSRNRHWPRGSLSKCPTCDRDTFVGRDDHEFTVGRNGGVVIFRHLQGARCDSCGSQILEPADLVRVESEAAGGVVSDYEAKVSRIGSGTLGTYWPKDVVRNMELAPDKKAFIQVLDRETALIRFGKFRSRAFEDSRSPEAPIRPPGDAAQQPKRRRRRNAQVTIKQ